MIRILLVDHEPAVRKGLRLRLSAEPDMEVVSEAGDGEAAVRLVGELKPDVVLLAVPRHPPREYVKADVDAMHRAHDGALIFALTSVEDPELCAQASEFGFVACLSKESLCDEWVSAVRQAALRAGKRLEGQQTDVTGLAPMERPPPSQPLGPPRQAGERGPLEKSA